MESFLRYITVYLVTVVPLTAVIFLIFKFAFKVKDWYLADLTMFIMPVITYIILDNMRLDRLMDIPRRMSNETVSIMVGLACALVFLVRCVLGMRSPDRSKKISFIALVVMTFAAVGIFVVAPPFSE